MSTVSEGLLLHELLSSLPSKDLLRLRCVSKSWRALIDSPYFIRLHLNKSLKDIKSRRVLLVIAHGDDFCNMKYLFYVISVDPEFKFSIREVEPPIPNFSWLNLVYIGSCRSLICLKYFIRRLDNNEYEHKIVVWNPTTLSHRILPYALAPIPTEDRHYDISYAFGYDEVADDYKLVRLTIDWCIVDYEIKVYSLQSDTWNTWKEMDKVPTPIPIPWSMITRRILANGVVIWCSRERDSTAFSLLIIPLRTQVLQLVSIPFGDSELKDCFFGLFKACSCGFYYCDCKAGDLLKLINNIKSDTLTNLLLPNSNFNEGMDCLDESFFKSLCFELRSSGRNLLSESRFIYSNFVDSLFRVDRSNN